MITYSIIQKSQLEGAKRLDAEYYQPEYLKLKNIFNNCEFLMISDISLFVKKGIFDISPSKYINSGIPLVRVQNIKNGIIDENNLVYISEEDHKKENKAELNDFDFVLSKVGTVGEIAILKADYKKWNFSQNVIGVKLKKDKISAAYLLFFLLGKFGQLQIKRAEMGQVQPKLELEDIRKLKIVKTKEEKLFNNYLNDILNLQENSKTFYQQAENLLLEELKISEKDLDNQLSCVINLSDAKFADRFDAEYFEPKYRKITEHIKKNFKWSLLGDLASVKKGFEPGAESYREEGKQFIRVSSLSKYEISDSEQKCLSEELYNKLKADYEPQKGEILLTKDASPGIAYVLKENIEGIISSGILRLKLKDREIEDEYLALCLNSIIGKMQAERDAGGSVIMHWKPEEIKNVIIPILPKPIQQKISSLVRRSFESRIKAKQLLKEAKTKVEEMIEKGGDK